jgi:hypothetical protein
MRIAAVFLGALAVWLEMSTLSDMLETERRLRSSLAIAAALVGILLWLFAPVRTLKHCPQCRERIPAAARLCPHCGHNLRKFKAS